MGHERVTVQNLAVVKVDAENNLILVKGAVPGPEEVPGNNQRDCKVRQVSFTGKEEHEKWQTYPFLIWKAKKLAP